MGSNALSYEQIGDEIYIVLGDETIGRILDQGSDNYYVCLEDIDDEYPVRYPIHGLDNAKRLAEELATNLYNIRN